MKGKTQANAKK